MPRKSGGAQQLRCGDRVRITKVCYRHFLRGLVGRVTQVLNHGVIIALDNDPVLRQRVIGVAGAVGPKSPVYPRRIFQYHEVEKLDA
jgi:hypothetical protein